MKYCVVIKREFEEDCVLHYDFDKEPTRLEVLQKVLSEDLNYDDNYGKIKFWKVE
jgi:hypothetical protein